MKNNCSVWRSFVLTVIPVLLLLLPVMSSSAFGLTVSFSSGGNGNLYGTTTQTVASGSDTSEVLAVPVTGYEFVDWTIDDSVNPPTSSVTNPLVIVGVTTDLFITANFAVRPVTVALLEYSMPLLSPSSQLSTLWTNVIPNALASYFTYIPYSNADAVALGFPANCGNRALSTLEDQASTEDCYTITVKKFPQQLALPGIFQGGTGLLDQAGAAFGATTQVYGYGSGGINWTPPGAAISVTGNAPMPFVDGTFSTAGVWHFPAPTIRGTKGRPIRVQWLNELPNEAPAGFDPTVDCGPNAPDCYPYNRIVTHVHGAHVQDDSDGYAAAWFTPGFAGTGPGWAASTYGPEGTYWYPMDQEASTIWYHDHAMGTTHLNTQMGMAGFFPITDANEQALIAANILPTGNYELGFALQDRMFDTNGQFAMPDAPVIDAAFPGCNPSSGATRLATCSPLFMKAADGHLIPYVADDPLLVNTNNADAPFLASSTTLEYVGNMPVVNGVTYGTYRVEPRIYRMRFIGGTDSRTWVMKLVRRDNEAVVPFWQVGSEQGLLNNPVSRDSIDLMPGERVDVLVNLRGIPVGTKIVMQNLGPDDPYAGMSAPPAPSSEIPEIMEFTVIDLEGEDNIIAPTGATVLRSPITPLVTTNPGNPRVISLTEGFDLYGRTMPSIDDRGFMEMGIPATELVRLNDIEEWDIVNTTVDAHPIHLHLVQFQVVHRQIYDTFTPATKNTVTQEFTPASYTAGLSAPVPPDDWDAGWKDTVVVPPGMVTRIRAKFDIAGDKYVYHCHILSHEEHDMMRPLVVFADGSCGTANGATFTTEPSADLCAPGIASARTFTGTGWEWTCAGLYQGSSPSGTCSATIQTYTVTANAAGSEEGSVSSNTGGILYSYPATNSATTTALNHGTLVTLTATPVSATAAAWWTTCPGTTGGTLSAATCTFGSLDGNKIAEASFTRANFTWHQLPDRIVSFTDTSTNTPTSWHWNFGDTTSGTAQNPLHQYSASNIYPVTLTATGSGVSPQVTIAVPVSSCFLNVTHIAGSGSYGTLLDTYTAASTGNVIEMQATTVGTAPVFSDLSKAVTLMGGFDCNYLVNNWVSTITGPVTISGGAITISNLAIQ
ncbi:MAG: hypothetical protein C0402_12540 [Thermodesulfovibrio sp.]|nr:hypothetical protein [Thermodesulfovibrio sp.]